MCSSRDTNALHLGLAGGLAEDIEGVIRHEIGFQFCDPLPSLDALDLNPRLLALDMGDNVLLRQGFSIGPAGFPDHYSVCVEFNTERISQSTRVRQC